jgi:glycerophosphoryl diester phosphodiesterase
MAHRGASDLAPENSMSSFALALEHGADLIETDLWFAADDEIVCVHVRRLERTTGWARDVTTVHSRELARVPLVDTFTGRDDMRVPRLCDVLDAVPDTTPIVLELKDPRFIEPMRRQRLLALLAHRTKQQAVAVISFDLRVLVALKAAAAGLVTGHIAVRNPLGTAATDMLGPWWPLLFVNPFYVRRAHARGQVVCPLDPYLHRHLPRWLALDVDAVLTNDPRATRRELLRLRDPAHTRASPR